MYGLEITEIAIRPCLTKPDGDPFLGHARIVFNDAFAVTGIRIIETFQGPAIAFPRDMSNKQKQKMIDVCHPIRRDLHDFIKEKILAEYRRAIA